MLTPKACAHAGDSWPGLCKLLIGCLDKDSSSTGKRPDPAPAKMLKRFVILACDARRRGTRPLARTARSLVTLITSKVEHHGIEGFEGAEYAGALRGGLVQEGGYGALARGCDAAGLQSAFAAAAARMVEGAAARDSLPLLAKTLQVLPLLIPHNESRVDGHGRVLG